MFPHEFGSLTWASFFAGTSIMCYVHNTNNPKGDVVHSPCFFGSKKDQLLLGELKDEKRPDSKNEWTWVNLTQMLNPPLTQMLNPPGLKCLMQSSHSLHQVFVSPPAFSKPFRMGLVTWRACHRERSWLDGWNDLHSSSSSSIIHLTTLDDLVSFIMDEEDFSRWASTITLFSCTTGHPLFKRQWGKLNALSDAIIIWMSKVCCFCRYPCRWNDRSTERDGTRTSLESTKGRLPWGCCVQGLAPLHLTQELSSHSSVSLLKIQHEICWTVSFEEILVVSLVENLHLLRTKWHNIPITEDDDFPFFPL